MIAISDSAPDTTPIQKFGNKRVSDTEPNEENASNSLRLSVSIFAEPWPSVAAADCAANSWRELARIASASCFIASHFCCDCSSAATAAAPRTAVMPRSSLPLRSASSTCENTVMSRASASPAAAAAVPPARISVTRRAIEPATTTCCRAL
ncbi:hypothetical protein D3C72_965520 [compost metagenome]